MITAQYEPGQATLRRDGEIVGTAYNMDRRRWIGNCAICPRFSGEGRANVVRDMTIHISRDHK